MPISTVSASIIVHTLPLMRSGQIQQNHQPQRDFSGDFFATLFHSTGWYWYQFIGKWGFLQDLFRSQVGARRPLSPSLSAFRSRCFWLSLVIYICFGRLIVYCLDVRFWKAIVSMFRCQWIRMNWWPTRIEWSVCVFGVWFVLFAPSMELIFVCFRSFHCKLSVFDGFSCRSFIVLWGCIGLLRFGPDMNSFVSVWWTLWNGNT